jgi:hypothetical protein
MNLDLLATYPVLGPGTADRHAIGLTRPEAIVPLGPILNDINDNKFSGPDRPGDRLTDTYNLRRNGRSDGARSVSKSNMWVQVAGGLALLIGLQHLRRHWV